MPLQNQYWRGKSPPPAPLFQPPLSTTNNQTFLNLKHHNQIPMEVFVTLKISLDVVSLA